MHLAALLRGIPPEASLVCELSANSRSKVPHSSPGTMRLFGKSKIRTLVIRKLTSEHEVLG